MAAFLAVDMSEVEARHASLRRLLLGKSVQTHRTEFPDLSAQWVASQHAQLAKAMISTSGRESPVEMSELAGLGVRDCVHAS